MTSKRSPIGAELRVLLGDMLRTRHVAQPLVSCDADDESQVSLAVMQSQGFSVLGVQVQGQVVGVIHRSALQNGICRNQLEPLTEEQWIDGEKPLLDLLRRLRGRHWLVVRYEEDISGFVSRSDLQRAPVRMLLFGLISLFEMLLHDLVQNAYSEETIQVALNANRLERALRLHTEREKRGEELELADCLQIADKRDLLLAVDGLALGLGFESNNAANRFFGDVERLRDRLVHANDLVAGSSWEQVLGTTLQLADFLVRCAQVENKAP